MSVLPYIVDGTAENFPRLVLENSRKGPVVVNFWSPKAGPCLVAMPRLVRVASEYGGRLLIVMFNIDDHGELARHQQVRALPLLRVFRDGVVIDSLQGVESEPALRAFLDKYGARWEAALRASERGETARAAALAAQAALARPEDPNAALRVAQLLLLDRRPQEAFGLLDALPEEVRGSPEIEPLHAHLALLVAMGEGEPTAGEAGECAAVLFREAARALGGDDVEGACLRLLASARSDPAYRGGLAYRAARALLGLPLEASVRARLEVLLSRAPGCDF